MSMFGNLTAGYIVEAIEEKMEEVKAMNELDDKAKINVLHGLELAKNIAARYED